jgi:hypothetical protein
MQKSKSIDQFLSLLRAARYEPYYRTGKLTGVKHDGIKYRFSRLGYVTEVLNQPYKEQNREESTLNEIRVLRQKRDILQKENIYLRIEK